MLQSAVWLRIMSLPCCTKILVTDWVWPIKAEHKVKYLDLIANSLFIYQDENQNQCFRLFLYVLKQTCDERTNNSM